MLCVALGVHKSSEIDEETWFQNRLHQCLYRVKETYELLQSKAKQIVQIIIVLHHVKKSKTAK